MVKTKQFNARMYYVTPSCKSVMMQSCKMLCQSRQFTFDEVSGGGIGNLDGVDTGDDL